MCSVPEQKLHLGYKTCTFLENYSKCRIWILGFSTNFRLIETDLSGNTVWPQALGFQKLAKMEHFWHFFHSKYKRSSLRSQCRLSQRIENSYKWYLFFAHFAKKVSKGKNNDSLKQNNLPLVKWWDLCFASLNISKLESFLLIAENANPNCTGFRKVKKNFLHTFFFRWHDGRQQR